jgi:hypothetical protein
VLLLELRDAEFAEPLDERGQQVAIPVRGLSRVFLPRVFEEGVDDMGDGGP